MAERFQDIQTEELLVRVRSGSQHALSQIVRMYSPVIRLLIGRRLPAGARSATDSEDVEQSVWRSFFAGLGHQYLAVSASQLNGLLKRMASNKAIDCGRKYMIRQKHERNCKEQPGLQENMPVRRDPTPSEVLIGKEALARLIESVPPRFAEAVAMRAEGLPIETISEKLRLPARSLRRIFEQSRDRAI